MQVLDVVELPGTDLADFLLLVSFRGESLLKIGFQRPYLLDSIWYITLKAFPALRTAPPSVWKQLRVEFDELAIRPFVCQIRTEETQARKFAEFFGFKAVRVTPFVSHYRKEPN